VATLTEHRSETGATGAFAATLRTLAESPEYAAYLEMRDYVLRQLESEGALAGNARPSTYWQEELSGFDYMLDASPLIVRKLRHQCYHLTGLKVYDYRTHADKFRENLRRRLDMLKAKDPAGLLVPEARALGGFGHEIDGELYNVDTLKFYEAMIALELGGVLQGLRERDRKTVLEIGAGWGGFARVMKEKVPGITYVIVDLPQVLLFSGTYLKALYPHWKVFLTEAGATLPPERYSEYDLVLVPHFLFPQLPLPALDLAVNMVSFQEMTKAQVADYVERLYEAGCPFLYSLNRPRSAYNSEMDDVRSLMEKRYWGHTIPVLKSSYTTFDPAKIESGMVKSTVAPRRTDP
jgi:putative sugar O-methyltransferase